jgi:NTP pyrophosphatase (non-canonical NTP hydrolase)
MRKKDMNITEFSRKNTMRATYNFLRPPDRRNLEYFLIALTGELGEFANAYKKTIRKINPGTGRDYEAITQEDMASELADIQIYLDLLATSCEVDLAKAVKEKFNRVSDNLSCDIKIV